LLVDAGRYEVAPDSPFAIPEYQPPPSLLARLGDAGVAPDAVDHVVLTHSHFDHINGLTAPVAGQEEPCFPRARHYLGRADWQQSWLQDELRDPVSLFSRTLGLLHQRDLLALVDGDRDLTPQVRLIAAPGETPGHQIVRIHSEGHTLYCVGDLYHFNVEVDQPEWLVHWADPALMQRSRRALVEAALAENAFLVATHIRGVGRLQRTSAGPAWEVVQT
jgi:glyoxylase-like metal-dependent hydrolase (beta-lactamase superfamily II)